MNITVNILEKKLRKFADAYYNGKALISDAKYDQLENKLRELDPDNRFLKSIGAPIPQKKAKVKLGQPMPSLNKVKSQEALNKYLSASKSDCYMVMPKYDGAAIQLCYEKSKLTKILTRGDGETGGDISFMVKDFPAPKSIDKHLGKKVEVRGELMMKTSTFKNKYADKYENPRQLVSGVINSDGLSDVLKDCTFCAFQIYGKNTADSTQVLKNQGFNTHFPVTLTEKPSYEQLCDLLGKLRLIHDYELDGLVISTFKVENLEYGSNPKFSVAVKDDSQTDVATTEIVAIHWAETRTGKLFPRIEVKPVRLDGVTVTFASGKSASFVKKNGLGIGAKIALRRSGGVIPDILPKDILKRSNNIWLPDNAHFVGEHLFSSEERSFKSKVLSLSYYLAALGVEGLKSKNIETVFATNKLKPTIQNLHRILAGDQPGVYGVVWEKASQQYKTLMKSGVDKAKLLSAVGFFGPSFSVKRYELILSKIPFSKLSKVTADDLSGIHGLGGVLAAQILKSPNKVQKMEFLKANFKPLKALKPITGGPLTGKAYCFSGVRSKPLEARIVSLGGTVVDNVKKATTLVVKDPANLTSKVKAASKLGVNIIKLEILEKSLEKL